MLSLLKDIPVGLSVYLASSYSTDQYGIHPSSMGFSYVPAVGSLVCGLSGHFECDIGWGRALQLKGRGGEVVEVLVEKLQIVSSSGVQAGAVAA